MYTRQLSPLERWLTCHGLLSSFSSVEGKRLVLKATFKTLIQWRTALTFRKSPVHFMSKIFLQIHFTCWWKAELPQTIDCTYSYFHTTIIDHYLSLYQPEILHNKGKSIVTHSTTLSCPWMINKDYVHCLYVCLENTYFCLTSDLS